MVNKDNSQSTPGSNQSNNTTMQPNNTTSNNAVPNTSDPRVIGKYVKFNLPPYMPSNPEVWFSATEHIFSANSINTENEKFSYILQCMGTQELENIKDIIPACNDRKFTLAKERLLKLQGISKEEKIRRALNNTQIKSNTKPSVILAQLKDSIDINDNSNLICTLWMEKLPQKMKEFLISRKNESIDILADLADDLHEIYEKNNTANVSVVNFSDANVQSTNKTNDYFANRMEGKTEAEKQTKIMIALLQNLTSQVAEIRANR